MFNFVRKNSGLELIQSTLSIYRASFFDYSFVKFEVNLTGQANE